VNRDHLEGVAYSYIRFSAKEQERGDSLRRQTDLRDAWLAKHPSVQLDKSLTFRDLGVSAFRGRHRTNDANGLNQFFRGVESGRIPRGSLLIIENLDRLSREDELQATHTFTGLLLAGITVVQLEPETIFDRSADQLAIMRAVLELGRGHAESARKSVRVKEAWDAKKNAIREPKNKGEKVTLTRRCPAWLELVKGQWQFRRGARDLIQRMVTMCRDGYGCRAIASAFNAEKVPPWSPAWVKGDWEEAYIRRIISGREILGEYQPMTRNPNWKSPGERKPEEPRGKPKRIPDGDPVKNYYPAAITEAEWHAANAARELRDKRGGRPTKDAAHVNPFLGLLRDARSGKPLLITGRLDRGRYYRVLTPAGYKRHGDKCVSFPLPAFEEVVLDHMHEIDPREILPGNGKPLNNVLELGGRLAGIDRRIHQVQTELTEGDADVSSLMAAMRTLEKKRKEANSALVSAQLAAANPLAESWGEAKSLIDTLKSAKDEREERETRVRLRGVLGRTITSVYCLFMVRSSDYQFAAVQVRFQPEDRQRSYLIYYRSARLMTASKTTRAGECGGKSFADVGLPTDLDLRKSADVTTLEKRLAKITPELLAAPTTPTRKDSTK